MSKTPTKNTLKRTFSLFWRESKSYIRQLIDIEKDCDAEATIANISAGVEFRGVNVWILAFAIVIASVGLNVNSTAVIIGAMLVSPLMGPILGFGLGVGISDSDLIRRSFKNLIIMMLISLLASATYFLLTPLSDAQSELLARTTPTAFDVLIAFFGGLAGIVATSLKHEKVTVVSGVAIATALMPPLCTAGYGLATAQWSYFFGAFYLFSINSFYIALATFLMVRYLKFPRKSFVDAQHERRVRRSIIAVSILVLVPSILIAIGLIRETTFNSRAIKYVSDIEHSSTLKEIQIINVKRQYDRKAPTITLSLVGKQLTEEQVDDLQRQLDSHGLPNTKLILRQTAGATLDINAQSVMIQQLLERKDNQLANRDSTILALREEIKLFASRTAITPEQLSKEVHILFPSVSSLSYSIAEEVDIETQTKQQLPLIHIAWSTAPDSAQLTLFDTWAKTRIGSDAVKIVSE